MTTSLPHELALLVSVVFFFFCVGKGALNW